MKLEENTKVSSVTKVMKYVFNNFLMWLQGFINELEDIIDYKKQFLDIRVSYWTTNIVLIEVRVTKKIYYMN